MKIFITFDHEIFFGTRTGTPEKCMVEPTTRLMQLARKYNISYTFFLDVLYLMKLKEYSHIDKLNSAYKKIQQQLVDLVNEGHDIQLHLHTHWVNASYNNEWKLDYKNYRIHNFSGEEIENIVERSVAFIQQITERKVFAFRAGGWCLQPFNNLYSSFINNGIWLDSTVFHNGYSQSPTNSYDFRQSPGLDTWSFSDDPMKVERSGRFTELPIASCLVQPSFFFQSLLKKKLFPAKHTISGDGEGISKSKAHYIKMLSRPTHTAVSCDGYKSRLMEKASRQNVLAQKENFVVIGHPKLMTEYSFAKLEEFILNKLKEGHVFTNLNAAFGSKS